MTDKYKSQKKYYTKNKKAIIAKKMAKVRLSRENVNRRKLASGCFVCGYAKIPEALHYHHVDPSSKSDTVANLFARESSIEKIENEISKCILLCANCHIEKHARNEI